MGNQKNHCSSTNRRKRVAAILFGFVLCLSVFALAGTTASIEWSTTSQQHLMQYTPEEVQLLLSTASASDAFFASEPTEGKDAPTLGQSNTSSLGASGENTFQRASLRVAEPSHTVGQWLPETLEPEAIVWLEENLSPDTVVLESLIEGDTVSLLLGSPHTESSYELVYLVYNPSLREDTFSLQIKETPLTEVSYEHYSLASSQLLVEERVPETSLGASGDVMVSLGTSGDVVDSKKVPPETADTSPNTPKTSRNFQQTVTDDTLSLTVSQGIGFARGTFQATLTMDIRFDLWQRNYITGERVKYIPEFVNTMRDKLEYWAPGANPLNLPSTSERVAYLTPQNGYDNENKDLILGKLPPGVYRIKDLAPNNVLMNDTFGNDMFVFEIKESNNRLTLTVYSDGKALPMGTTYWSDFIGGHAVKQITPVRAGHLVEASTPPIFDDVGVPSGHVSSYYTELYLAIGNIGKGRTMYFVDAEDSTLFLPGEFEVTYYYPEDPTNKKVVTNTFHGLVFVVYPGVQYEFKYLGTLPDHYETYPTLQTIMFRPFFKKNEIVNDDSYVFENITGHPNITRNRWYVYFYARQKPLEPFSLYLVDEDEPATRLDGGAFTILERYQDPPFSGSYKTITRKATMSSGGQGTFTDVRPLRQYTLLQDKAPDRYKKRDKRYGFTIENEGIGNLNYARRFTQTKPEADDGWETTRIPNYEEKNLYISNKSTIPPTTSVDLSMITYQTWQPNGSPVGVVTLKGTGELAGHTYTASIPVPAQTLIDPSQINDMIITGEKTMRLEDIPVGTYDVYLTVPDRYTAPFEKITVTLQEANPQYNQVTFRLIQNNHKHLSGTQSDTYAFQFSET